MVILISHCLRIGNRVIKNSGFPTCASPPIKKGHPNDFKVPFDSVLDEVFALSEPYWRLNVPNVPDVSTTNKNGPYHGSPEGPRTGFQKDRMDHPI